MPAHSSRRRVGYSVFSHPDSRKQTWRYIVRTLGSLLVGVFVVGLLAQSALARPPYKKVLDAQAKDTKIAPVVETLKCNFCHVEKEEKKVRNTYGQALVKSGLNEEVFKELKTDEEKLAACIKAVMKKAEAEKAASGETFGDLIKAGKAPGTAPKK
jgi:hypothetical protein